jgi:hypothetical protein
MRRSRSRKSSEIIVMVIRRLWM